MTEDTTSQNNKNSDGVQLPAGFAPEKIMREVTKHLAPEKLRDELFLARAGTLTAFARASLVPQVDLWFISCFLSDLRLRNYRDVCFVTLS